MRGDIELAKVPEDASVAVLELNVVPGLHVGPVGKTVNTGPVVAAGDGKGRRPRCKDMRGRLSACKGGRERARWTVRKREGGRGKVERSFGKKKNP